MNKPTAVQQLWVFIPARGGSRGIPRKNLILCGGKPLIQWVIETALRITDENRVLVVSDDEEIVWFAKGFGIKTILEKSESDSSETLDEKVSRNIPALRKLGASSDDVIMTIQPTSPLIREETLRLAFGKFRQGANSVISVVEERHLNWFFSKEVGTVVPLYDERVNRQYLNPLLRETGGIVAARLGDIERQSTRLINPVELVTVSEAEGVDIDSYGDLLHADHLLTRSKILIRTEIGAQSGLESLYRGLAIAYGLYRHEVTFVSETKGTVLKNLLGKTPFPLREVAHAKGFCRMLSQEKPELLFLDSTDTTIEEVEAWRKASPSTKIITFEDNGEGAKLCDARVYNLTYPSNRRALGTICGITMAVLEPSFELLADLADSGSATRDLLIAFGGLDSYRLTEKVLDALESLGFPGSVTVLIEPGANQPDLSLRDIDVRLVGNVRTKAILMCDHKLAISSMGRTVFELASCAVPVLCFAQNERELSYSHIGPETGSVFGGPGYSLFTEEMVLRIGAFLKDKELHLRLRQTSAAFRSERSNRGALEEMLSATGLDSLLP